MKRLADERMISRNARLGKILLYGGLVIMAGGMFVVSRNPEWSTYALAPALAGLMAIQFGSAFMSRWSRRPRLDEIADEALKGLDGRYALIHYKLATPHALFTPSGVYALILRTEDGELRFRNGRWERTTEGRGLRRGGTRTLRSVETLARADADAMASALRKRLPEGAQIPVEPLLMFIHNRAVVHGESSPIPAFHAKKAKEALRRQPKRPGLTEEQLARLSASLRLVAD
ncbi:MAG: hypothetical protein MUO23_14245 [Anaerolineales bacterium]|nr:hypothetical protein [Anaerolineales bacterium]